MAVYEEMQAKKACYEMIVRSHIIEVLGLLLRYFPHQVKETSRNTSSVKGKELVQFALHYIETNYTKNISLNGVASYLGISENYLSRLFNQLTGQTFRTYLNNIRLGHAQKLLSSTEKSIIDIAFESGFNSLRTFNRVYKSTKGIVPSDYR
jgi:AraC-like DNA-binding protein